MKIKTFTSDAIPDNLQDGETMFETDTNNLAVQYGGRLFIFKPDNTRNITGAHEDLHYPQGIYSDSVERYYITTSPVIHLDASHHDGGARTYTGVDSEITTWINRSDVDNYTDVRIDTADDNSVMYVEHQGSSNMPGIRFNTQADSLILTNARSYELTAEEIEAGIEEPEVDGDTLDYIPFEHTINDVDDCTMIVVKQFNSVNPTVGTIVHPTFGTINTAPWNSIMPFNYDANNVNNTWNDLISTRGLWDQEVNKWFHKSNTNQLELITITKQSNTRQVKTYFNGMIDNNYNWTSTAHNFVFDSIHPGGSTFYEILFFDKVLSDVTINIIFSYLKNKYPLEHAPAWPV